MTLSPVGECVVQSVLLVARLRRPPGHRILASSLPGHLIQCMIAGRTLHEANGRRYELGPRSVIWYHEDELVRGAVRRGPWEFYSVNFVAPGLAPPPFERRVWTVDAATVRRFADLLIAWNDDASPPALRQYRVQSRILDLLGALASSRGREVQPSSVDPSARLWWDVETKLRRDLSAPMTLTRMEELSGKSQATIARACEAAVGTSPVRRMKQVRLSLARGLVQRSDLRLKEIASRVGYGRVHEFTRDYRKQFDIPPGRDRASAVQIG